MESGITPDTPAAPDNIAATLRKSRRVCVMVNIFSQEAVSSGASALLWM
jgi:hypothetical protein